MAGALVLADGTVFTGEVFGSGSGGSGEVVFNTGIVGYQEELTDPANAGQILVMTYPLIGNYGVNRPDRESDRIWVSGLVVREICREYSNWQAEESLPAYLARAGVMGLAGVDTRALTRHLRQHGTMPGVITADISKAAELSREMREQGIAAGPGNRSESVSTTESYTLPGEGHKVVLVDYGVRRSVIRQLQQFGCEVTLVPAATTAAAIWARQPEGVVLSSGAGDPQDRPEAVALIQNILGRVPVFGIGLGHQILALALGASTYKMRFGHRGANQPVQDLSGGPVRITTQNHGYAVEADSLDPATAVLTEVNLHDRTVEGLRHRELLAFSVQYQPDAAAFRRFLESMQLGKRG